MLTRASNTVGTLLLEDNVDACQKLATNSSNYGSMVFALPSPSLVESLEF